MATSKDRRKARREGRRTGREERESKRGRCVNGYPAVAGPVRERVCGVI
jgi:hypothetical protein